VEWLLIILVGVLIGAGTFLVRVRAKQRAAMLDRPASAPGDYSVDREASRVSRLSADDRAWETASLQRSRDAAAKSDGSAPPA
jgi:hypothetical protein